MSFNESEKSKCSGQITAIDPNYRQKSECKCKKLCSSSRTCVCHKFGSRCNENCSCRSMCENMFNDLQYFFGEKRRYPYSASPCFNSYLIKHGMNGFEKIDRDELRNKILSSGSTNSRLNVDVDKKIVDWTNQWNSIRNSSNEVVKLEHHQKLFRFLLSNESEFYYSFCDSEMHRKSCYWHCLICQKCVQWRCWHCRQCNKCRSGLNNPCRICGGTYFYLPME